MLDRVKLCYMQAGRMVGVPYVFGGAHGITTFREPVVWRQGVDCSSGASIILSAGGLLASPRAPYAFDTHAFERWGLPGVGRWLTVWVLDLPTLAAAGFTWAQHLIDQGETHHAALDFHGDGAFHYRFWQATHTGGPVGWVGFDPTAFHARHWPWT